MGHDVIHSLCMKIVLIRHIGLLFLFMLIVFPVHALSEELRFGYENYPPLTYEENGQPQGISIDLVREASRRLGFIPVFVNRPFARLLNEVQHGDIDCVMDVYKSPEREVYLYYPTSFVNPDQILLYVNSASGLDIRSFNDVGERKVGVVRGYFYGTGRIGTAGTESGVFQYVLHSL